VTLASESSSGLIVQVDSGGTPSTANNDFWDGDIPWLTPKEITFLEDGLYVSRTERMITKEGLAGSSAKLLPPGTVMLTKRAPVGAVAINAVPMATNQGFLNFRCGSMLRPAYLAYWFRVIVVCSRRDHLPLRGHTFLHEIRELTEYEFADLGFPIATSEDLEDRADEFAMIAFLLPIDEAAANCLKSAVKLESWWKQIGAVSVIIILHVFMTFFAQYCAIYPSLEASRPPNRVKECYTT